MQELVLSAGHVVELPASDYVSTVSGDMGRSSHKKASSTTEGADRPSGEDDDSSLMWKVQVSDLQAAFLSSRRLGTAQFVADDCTVSQSRLSSSVKVEVRPHHLNSAHTIRTSRVLQWTGPVPDPYYSWIQRNGPIDFASQKPACINVPTHLRWPPGCIPCVSTASQLPAG